MNAAPGPWSNVIARGAISPALLAMLGWVIAADYARIVGGASIVPRAHGKVFSGEWAQAFAGVFVYVAPSALVFAALLAGIMMQVEREEVRSPLYWELAGFAAAAPLLLWSFWTLSQAGRPATDGFLPLIALGLLSLFGSNAARKARHGRAK